MLSEYFGLRSSHAGGLEVLRLNTFPSIVRKSSCCKLLILQPQLYVSHWNKWVNAEVVGCFFAFKTEKANKYTE